MIYKKKFYLPSYEDARQYKFSASRHNDRYYENFRDKSVVKQGEPDIPFSAMVYIKTDGGLMLWTHGDFVANPDAVAPILERIFIENDDGDSVEVSPERIRMSDIDDNHTVGISDGSITVSNAGADISTVTINDDVTISVAGMPSHKLSAKLDSDDFKNYTEILDKRLKQIEQGGGSGGGGSGGIIEVTKIVLLPQREGDPTSDCTIFATGGRIYFTSNTSTFGFLGDIFFGQDQKSLVDSLDAKMDKSAFDIYAKDIERRLKALEGGGGTQNPIPDYKVYGEWEVGEVTGVSGEIHYAGGTFILSATATRTVKQHYTDGSMTDLPDETAQVTSFSVVTGAASITDNRLTVEPTEDGQTIMIRAEYEGKERLATYTQMASPETGEHFALYSDVSAEEADEVYLITHDGKVLTTEDGTLIVDTYEYLRCPDGEFLANEQ